MNSTPRLPYEMANAREWEMNRGVTDGSDTSGGDFDDWGDDSDDHSPSSTRVIKESPKTPDATPDDDDGFHTVQRSKKKYTAPHVSTSKLSQVKVAISVPTVSLPSVRLKNGPGFSTPIRRPKKIFDFRKDNQARADFRMKKPHNDSFHLTRRSDLIEPDRKRMYDMLEEIGVRLHSFILPPQTPEDQILLIWGNNAQVSATKVALNDWSTSIARRLPLVKSAKDNFAKITSTIGIQYQNQKAEFEKVKAIIKFQRMPEPGLHFKYTGTYLWPLEEIRPSELFGPNLEAWDQHRYVYRCHIVFDETTETFHIYTNKHSSVQITLECIEGSLKHFTVRSNPRIIENILEPPVQETKTGLDVMIQENTIGNNGSKIPALTGKTLNDALQLAWISEAQNINQSNDFRIINALYQMVYKLPYYHGNIRMRVNFGTYALTTFHWPPGKATVPFAEFNQNIAKPGTKGTLIRDLIFAKHAQNIMGQIWQASELLVPADNSIDLLKDVLPVVSARFEINRLGKPAIQLEIEMKGHSFYDVSQASWTRLDSKDKAAAFDLSNIRLTKGAPGVSWKLSISVDNPLDVARIDPEMVQFQESVMLKKGLMTEVMVTGAKMFEWQHNSNGILPTVFEQKTALRYRLAQAQQYTFEMARYDCYGDACNPDRPVTTNWCASLWNRSWDDTLTDNAGLKIGKAASWRPNISTFFPDPEGGSAGVQKFQDVVQQITACLDAIKSEK